MAFLSQLSDNVLYECKTSVRLAASLSLSSSSSDLSSTDARFPQTLNGDAGTLPARRWLSVQHTHTEVHINLYLRLSTWPLSPCLNIPSLYTFRSSKLDAPQRIPAHITLFIFQLPLFILFCAPSLSSSCFPDISLINTQVMNYIVVLVAEPTRTQSFLIVQQYNLTTR